MRKFILMVLIAIFAIGVSSVAQANLLTNGSFETGDVTGWSAEYNPQNIGTSSENPQQGSYNGRCFWDGVAYQEVAIIGGQQYRLTGYANIPAGGQTQPWNSFIGLRMYNSTGGQVFDIETNLKDLERGLYHLMDSGLVTAPGTAVKARVRWGTWSDAPHNPAKPTDFDNFDLSGPAVPEPTTLLLLGSGLMGIFGFTRKRKA